MSEPELTEQELEELEREKEKQRLAAIEQTLRWAESSNYVLADIRHDEEYPTVVRRADVVWPDGGTGQLITTAIAEFEADGEVRHMIDEYSMTHLERGLKVYQGPCEGRDEYGCPLNEPQMSILGG